MIETPADYRSFVFLGQTKPGLFACSSSFVSHRSYAARVRSFVFVIARFLCEAIVSYTSFFGRVLSGQAFALAFL
jgi:hypothetical protein